MKCSSLPPLPQASSSALHLSKVHMYWSRKQMNEPFRPCHNVIWKYVLCLKCTEILLCHRPFFITSRSLWCSLTNLITCSLQENDKLGSARKLTKETPSCVTSNAPSAVKNQFIFPTSQHPFAAPLTAHGCDHHG